jgi:antirestriction protein ArdC
MKGICWRKRSSKLVASPVVVFNAVDLEADALSDWVEQRQAEALLGAWPVPVSYGGERACYLPQIDRIQLPERAIGASCLSFCCRLQRHLGA